MASTQVEDAPTSPQKAAAIIVPPQPKSFEDVGLPFTFVCDLLLKILYFNGGLLGRQLAEISCLPYEILEKCLKFLSDEGYSSSTGINTASVDASESLGATMQYVMTSSGRSRARELLDINQYAGPAPVPLEVYNAMARQQANRSVAIDRQTLAKAYEELVLNADILDRIGPALASRQAIFVYGPPGNGKTSIALGSAKVLGPAMFVPRSLYFHGEVIRFFDPLHHTPIDRPLPPHDNRWQLAERPLVKVGGELVPEMLDLSFDRTLGFYDASLQLKANGGTFLVDDFGRQHHLAPRDLLNRLIVPLEGEVDYLNIARAGTSVAVPFTCSLILSTNLRPHELVDEAFLRRVRWKVYVPNPNEEEYREIWRRASAKEGMFVPDAVLNRLIDREYKGKRPMHGVHPRDLINHASHAARYMGLPLQMTDALLDFACETYFVDFDKEDW